MMPMGYGPPPPHGRFGPPPPPPQGYMGTPPPGRNGPPPPPSVSMFDISEGQMFKPPLTFLNLAGAMWAREQASAPKTSSSILLSCPVDSPIRDHPWGTLGGSYHLWEQEAVSRNIR